MNVCRNGQQSELKKQVAERRVRARWVVTLFLLLVGGCFSLSRPVEAAPAGEPPTVYLPLLVRPDEGPAGPGPCQVSGSSYATLTVNGEPSDRPAPEHPDLNLAVRGWQPSDGALSLVDYGPGMDPDAPQLDTLFGDRRLPTFTGGWDVYGWDWEAMEPIEVSRPWKLTLLGMAVAADEAIHTPDGGYDIGQGYDALVLYASPSQLTLKYTREDNVIEGYTVHLEQICVEPDLLALYEQANAAGRSSLPAVRGGQPLGRALGEQILVAVRDSGSFMDPRADDDWWRAH